MPHTGEIQRKLSKLQAVNIVLRGAREQPVSDLVEDATNDSLVAEQVIDEHSLAWQSLGMFNNTFERDLVPATVASGSINIGDVILPNNTLMVTSWSRDIRMLIDAREDAGSLKLYNLEFEEETFDFSDKDCVTVRMILQLDWDDLSSLQQRAIADAAAEEYQMAVFGSQPMDAKLTRRASISRAQARAENARKMRPNLFSNSRSTGGRAGARAVARPYFTEGDGSTIHRRTGR